MLRPIIQSLASQDSYKISMLQAVLHRAPGVQTMFRFKCRNKIDLCPYAGEIRAQIDALADLKFTEDELSHLARRRYFKPDLIDFLRTFRFNPKNVTITTHDGKFDLSISGTWAYVMLFEIFILSIISEVYYRCTIQEGEFPKYYALAERDLRLELEKIKDYVSAHPSFDPFKLIEFGTRRRFTSEWQERVIQILMEEIPDQLMGTSNEDLARRYNIKAEGTMAHEFLQAHQAMDGIQLAHSQRAALETWVQEYRGDLGIALTDVINMDAFLCDFDLFYAKLFDGLRHDSGDPYLWGEKAIAHYLKLGIDPKTKVLVFSDGLDIDKALALHSYFNGRIKTGFGIGTKLTNNIPGITPLNIVLKMVQCNGRPVAKISDAPGKSMCEDADYYNYLCKVFKCSPTG